MTPLPQLFGRVGQRGYLAAFATLTTAKPCASTILRTPPVQAEPDQLDPVLATRRFGLGVTAAWTSDFAPPWAKDWLDWDKYRAFVKQLAIELSRVETKSDLRLSTFAADNSGAICVEDFAKDEAFLRVEARVAGPRGESVTVPLRQIGPRRYQGSFPLWGKGRYLVIAATAGRSGTTEPENVTGGFAVPYSPEYLRFRSNPRVLQEIARKTGGRVLSSTDTDLFHPPRHPRESSSPVIDWFLLVLACLLPLDVAIRRVQLDWSLIRGWFTRRPRDESPSTMGALLQRKQHAKTAQMPPARQPSQPVSQPAPEATLPPTLKSTKPTSADTPQSTTERLLARKRNRPDENK